MEIRDACVALNMIPGMGPVRLRRLMDHFESPVAILGAKESAFSDIPNIPKELARNLANWEAHVDLAAEWERVRSFGAKVICRFDENYPRQLATIHDPPIVLYVHGEITPADELAIGVVGSRRTSVYGLESAKKLSYQIAYAGITVISGLARGIDTAAHQSALAAKGRTIAVIGSGLMELYPPENQGLADKIIESGAVVSEFSMATKPDRQTFPIRNRIISGWSSGVLVIEAGASSGALITTAQALDQGRSLYAVPGPINRPTSTGCNRLIQQGAKLVLDASDILEDLDQLLPAKNPRQNAADGDASLDLPVESAPARALPRMTEMEEKVFQSLHDEPTPIDVIGLKTGLPSHILSSTLLALELRKLVRQLPGKQFVKIFHY